MIPVKFDYVAPSGLSEAVGLLAGHANAAVVAGGVSLIPALTAGRLAPGLIVDLGKVSGLSGITTGGGTVRIGATTTYAGILDAPDLHGRFTALAQAVGSSGDPLTRNRGTLGGSLAGAHPADGVPAALIALDATVEIVGPAGQRTVPVEGLAIAAHRTTLAPGEIITAVILPDNGWASQYASFDNPGALEAVCGVAAAVGRDGGRVTAVRVAASGAAGAPLRLPAVEAAVAGRVLTADVAAIAADAVSASGIDFRSDLAATAEYRAHLTGVLAGRALAALIS